MAAAPPRGPAMVSSAGYRFMALLVVLYLVTTAFFLLFIQHTSERHLTARHPARSPLRLRRAQMRTRLAPELPRRRHVPPPPPPPPREPAVEAVGREKQVKSGKILQAVAKAGRKAAEGRRPPLVKVTGKKAARGTAEADRAAGKRAAGARRPLILFWTPLWGRFDNWSRFFSVPRLGGCRARCSFANHEDQLEAAALVLFSAPDLDRMPPPAEAGRSERFPRQLWALLSLDPPPADTRLQPQQLDQLFNWTVSYRHDADVPLAYGRVVPLAKPDLRAAAVRLSPGRRALFRPQLCRTRSRREEYVQELSRHMDVDVVGPCGSVRCGAALQCMSNYADNHTFYLALEAADCDDFVSARLYQALRHGLIPVVRGGADYTRLAPPNSFIDAAQFSGPAALARHLRSMSDGQLRRYHRWRSSHQVLPADWACDVCTRLHQLATSGENMPAHGGEQLVEWWERGRCREDGTAPSAA